MTPQQRTRANALANAAMRSHGLDPKLDQKLRNPYFTRACEVVVKGTYDDLQAFEDLRRKAS